MLLSLNQKKIFFGCYGHFKIVQYLNIEFWYLSAPHPTFLQYRHKAMEGLFRLVISRGVKLKENKAPRVLKMHGHPHHLTHRRVSAMLLRTRSKISDNVLHSALLSITVQCNTCIQ